MSFTNLIPIEDLRAQVGEVVGQSDWQVIDQGMINAFADLTNDHHYIHIDPERAAKTMFGGTIAHGFFTLSFLSPMAFATVPVPDDLDHAINYGFDRLRFTGAVPAGAKVKAQFTLSQLEENGPKVKMVLSTTVETEGQTRPAIIADWIIVIVRHVSG
ncbi:MAG: MaoC family dehydratase [Pseudomonadota bacterium]